RQGCEGHTRFELEPGLGQEALVDVCLNPVAKLHPVIDGDVVALAPLADVAERKDQVRAVGTRVDAGETESLRFVIHLLAQDRVLIERRSLVADKDVAPQKYVACGRRLRD